VSTNYRISITLRRLGDTLTLITYHRVNEKKKATVNAYRKMIEIVPDLDNLSKRAAAESSHALIKLANLVSFCSPSNDIVLIRIRARICRQEGAHHRLRLITRKWIEVFTSP
jgi:hypothetical protein